MKNRSVSRDESDDSGLSDGEKFEKWIQKNADDLSKSANSPKRRVRRRRDVVPGLAPPAVEPPAASSSSGTGFPPAALVAAPAPPLFQDPGSSESWGPFSLSRVSKFGVVRTISCTCTRHTFEGSRCNKSINFDGVRMTEYEAELRIERWLVQGSKIPDGLGAKQKHMDEKPRRYSVDDLDEAELNRIVSSV